MCIICVKSKEAPFPTKSQVENMVTNNPDGFSLVYKCDKDKVRVFRTMSEASFMRAYNHMVRSCDSNNTVMFMHARIMTHGRKSVKNCHGWISENNKIVFAHNGILSVANRDDMTDSETFFRDIFEPVFQHGGWDAAEKAIKAIIGTSKFVFMDAFGTLRLYGDYVKEKNGLLFSNTSYLPRISYYRSFDPRSYSVGCSSLRNSTEYDKWWKSKKYNEDDTPF